MPIIIVMAVIDLMSCYLCFRLPILIHSFVFLRDRESKQGFELDVNDQ